MAALTLHSTTELTKKFALWIGLGILLILIIVFGIRTGKAIKNYLFPQGPPRPTVTYGKVPAPHFPENVTKEKLSFTIDTISGILPSFPPQMKVYQIIWSRPSLLSLSRAKEKVKSVGFTSPEKKISDEVYQWTNDDGLKKTMTMNIINQNFSMVSDYVSDPTINNLTSSPDESEATEIAKGYLASMGLLPSDIDISKTDPQLLRLKDGNLIPASSLSNSQLVKVDLYQKNIGDFGMYYPHPPHSTINFLVTGNDTNNVLDAQFFYEKIVGDGSTYPIKSAEQAFEELRSGKGYIAEYLGSDKTIKITDVKLGYFLEGDEQEFVTPIIVFHGESDFYAYIPAIPDYYYR